MRRRIGPRSGRNTRAPALPFAASSRLAGAAAMRSPRTTRPCIGRTGAARRKWDLEEAPLLGTVGISGRQRGWRMKLQRFASRTHCESLTKGIESCTRSSNACAAGFVRLAISYLSITGRCGGRPRPALQLTLADNPAVWHTSDHLRRTRDKTVEPNPFTDFRLDVSFSRGRRLRCRAVLPRMATRPKRQTAVTNGESTRAEYDGPLDLCGVIMEMSRRFGGNRKTAVRGEFTVVGPVRSAQGKGFLHPRAVLPAPNG
jgi:hypothetical protein